MGEESMRSVMDKYMSIRRNRIILCFALAGGFISSFSLISVIIGVIIAIVGIVSLNEMSERALQMADIMDSTKAMMESELLKKQNK